MALGADLLVLGGMEPDGVRARERLEGAISSGEALGKFQAMVRFQGGDPGVIEETGSLPQASIVEEGRAQGAGFIHSIDSLEVGMAVMELGAGRRQAGDRIDPACGLLLLKKVGDPVESGEPLFQVHASDSQRGRVAVERLLGAWRIVAEPRAKPELLLDRIRSGE